ncbi:Formyl peptide receptor 2 [Trichoplax sp. H2]|nr:Formyl peptide receptor 2 [Trichoplax sp. H2]|eukprot:RDD36374.1 Formyl peptide receptor 2 [Trichoplax sp. H2]
MNNSAIDLYNIALSNIVVSISSMFLSVFMFLGVVGNITVIMLLKPSRRASNEVAYDVLLYQLAFIDLTSCITNIPSLTVAIVATGNIRQIACSIAQTVSITAASMNCVILSMLSIERMVAISRRQLSSRLTPARRRSVYHLVLVGTWSITIIAAVINLTKFRYSVRYFSCFNIKSKEVEANPKITDAITYTSLPMIIWNVLLLSVAILLAIGSFIRVKNKIQTDLQNVNGNNRVLERNITKIGTLVVGTFFISYFPSAIIRIIGGEQNSTPTVIIRIVTSISGNINAFTNPLIYFFNHRKYRDNLVKAIQRNRRATVNQSGGQSPHNSLRYIRPSQMATQALIISACSTGAVVVNNY